MRRPLAKASALVSQLTPALSPHVSQLECVQAAGNLAPALWASAY
jgi:hypothetical protein